MCTIATAILYSFHSLQKKTTLNIWNIFLLSANINNKVFNIIFSCNRKAFRLCNLNCEHLSPILFCKILAKSLITKIAYHSIFNRFSKGFRHYGQRILKKYVFVELLLIIGFLQHEWNFKSNYLDHFLISLDNRSSKLLTTFFVYNLLHYVYETYLKTKTNLKYIWILGWCFSSIYIWY